MNIISCYSPLAPICDPASAHAISLPSSYVPCQPHPYIVYFLFLYCPTYLLSCAFFTVSSLYFSIPPLCLPSSPLRMLQIILLAPQTLPLHPHLFHQLAVNSSGQIILSFPTPVPPSKPAHPISTPLAKSQHFCTFLPLLNSTCITKVGQSQLCVPWSNPTCLYLRSIP